MKLEEMYAHALQGTEASDSKKVLEALKATLRARGHEKLLPRIYSSYQKLVLGKARMEMHKRVTPERERTRTLLELYRKLVASR
ncbi:MAG TPA: hypothetical protein VHD37_01660 [Candidatus Paceibacterota bacterium]|nr:hypothetical protein [Candidatus Paceibacterota bacterium]